MNKNETTKTTETTPPTFKKKIGLTTYEVSVLFNPNARETLHKKLERIILNSVQYDDF
jgi:hypothetical protein